MVPGSESVNIGAESARVRGETCGVGSEGASVGGVVLLLVTVLLEITDGVDVVLESADVRRVFLLGSSVDVARHVVILGHVWLNLEFLLFVLLSLLGLSVKLISVFFV